jgi:DNA polymerase III gamma/tau subunit
MNITKIIILNKGQIEAKSKQILKDFGFEKGEDAPDTYIISNEGKSSIGIDKVKNLRIWAYTKPYESDNKIIIIQRADLLTPQAQNSILKIIEEPPHFTHVYLLANSERNFLKTILSRTQLIDEKNDPDRDFVLAKKFIDSDLNNKFKQSEKLAKQSREEIQNFLDTLLEMSKRDKNDFQLIEKLIEYKRYISSNVNKKLILENLSIKIHKEKRLFDKDIKSR